MIKETKAILEHKAFREQEAKKGIKAIQGRQVQTDRMATLRLKVLIILTEKREKKAIKEKKEHKVFKAKRETKGTLGHKVFKVLRVIKEIKEIKEILVLKDFKVKKGQKAIHLRMPI